MMTPAKNPAVGNRNMKLGGYLNGGAWMFDNIIKIQLKVRKSDGKLIWLATLQDGGTQAIDIQDD